MWICWSAVFGLSEYGTPKSKKIIKTIAFFGDFKYNKYNRVARSLLDIGDQAETCAQLFYVKERFYGFEKTIDFR